MTSLLRSVRKKKKITLEQLSADTGISVSMLSRMETGERRVTLDHLPKLTVALGVPASALVDEVREVPLVGYVGAGAVAHFYADAQGPFDMVPAPDGATDQTVAAEIKGTSLGELFDTWLVFYDEVRNPVTPDLVGKLCIVGLPDGRVLVKKLQRSRTHGLYHLLSNTEAPILDAEVMWAAKVKNMAPR